MTVEWSPGLSVGGSDRLSLLSSQLSVPRAVLPSVLCPVSRVSYKFLQTTLSPAHCAQWLSTSPHSAQGATGHRGSLLVSPPLGSYLTLYCISMPT